MMDTVVLMLKIMIGFLLLVAVSEQFLKMKAYPRVWIVRGVGTDIEYMMQDGELSAKSYEDGKSFSYWNPLRHLELSKIRKDDYHWRFMRIHVTSTKVAVTTKTKIGTKE